MVKFYEVAYEGEESSFYVVFSNRTVGLFYQGVMQRCLMTLADCEELARCGHAVAYS